MPPEAEHEDDDKDTLTVIEPEDGDEGGDDSQPGGEPQSSEEAIRVATLMGWKPKEQWKGDTSNWRPAEDFLRETPEILKHTRKSNERLQGQMARIIGEVAKLSKNQRQQMDADAEAALEAAIEAGDTETAKKLLKQAREGATPDQSDEPQALADFKDRNASWYGVDDAATAYVAALDSRFAQETGGVKDPDAHMKRIETAVKARFPELFGPTDDKKDDPPKDNGRRAPLVNRGGRVDRRAPTGELTVADLTPAQRKGAAETGVTLDDYVKALNAWNKQQGRAA